LTSFVVFIVALGVIAWVLQMTPASSLAGVVRAGFLFA